MTTEQTMNGLRIDVVASLAGISDELLSEVTADGHTFANKSWFRLLDALPLSDVIGGTINLRWLVASVENTPIAVCPLMRATGDGVYFIYSLRQYFFEHWVDEAVRINPEKQAHFHRLQRGVAFYRRLLQATGSQLTDCLIVTNPLSYRGDIPVAPSSPLSRETVLGALIERLQQESRRVRRPLWFAFVEGDTSRLGKVLQERGCEKIFHFYDNRIKLDSFGSFDEYLHSFRRTTRRALQKDIRRTEEAGITFRFSSDLICSAAELTKLYEQTYSKYGDSHYRHGTGYWTALERELGNQVEVIRAEHHESIVGFSILLRNERRGEMWTYRIGRDNRSDLKDIPYYFGLSFYGPIARAIEAGYRRIWLGPASYEAKSVRGAEQVPLYSYYWFPRRLDRWLFLPFVRLFGQITREQIAESLDRPVRTEDEAANQKKISKQADQ